MVNLRCIVCERHPPLLPIKHITNGRLKPVPPQSISNKDVPINKRLCLDTETFKLCVICQSCAAATGDLNFMPEDQFDEEIGVKHPELTNLSPLETIFITRRFLHGTLFTIGTNGSITLSSIPLLTHDDNAIATHSLPISMNKLHKVVAIAGDLSADIVDMTPFCVRKKAIEDAASCLIATNPCYADARISQRRLQALPDDAPGIDLSEFMTDLNGTLFHHY